MPGSQLFWQSGTWLFFAGQLLFLVMAVVIYVYQGRKEAEARAHDQR